MPILNDTSSDTRGSHLTCLQRAGWMGFDTTHIGDPDGYLLTPCCEHGFRAAYGPRPKGEYIPYSKGVQQTRYKIVRQAYLKRNGNKLVQAETVNYLSPDVQPTNQGSIAVTMRLLNETNRYAQNHKKTNLLSQGGWADALRSYGEGAEFQLVWDKNSKRWKHASSASFKHNNNRLDPGSTKVGRGYQYKIIAETYTEDTGPGMKASMFTEMQKQGDTGSWVLVTGASVSDNGDLITTDAEAKWWATSQTDLDTVEEEIVGAAGLGKSHGRKQSGTLDDRPDAWMGLALKSGKNPVGKHYQGLRRWMKTHNNPRYGGDNVGVPGAKKIGIPDPGLGERSGLPQLGGVSRKGTSYWVQYGQRTFLGITQCFDPRNKSQYRKDHDAHGSGSNWRGIGVDDFDAGTPIPEPITQLVPPVPTPTETAPIDPIDSGVPIPSSDEVVVTTPVPAPVSTPGGYTPKIYLYGGDVEGAEVEPVIDADGNITSIKLLQPGTTVITDVNDTTLEPPNITLNNLLFYPGFSATAEVSDDPEVIKSVWPELFKTKEELMKEFSDGFADPLAQSFLVSGETHPDGVFAHSVDLCFQNKPRYQDGAPVILELRPMINGFPASQHFIAGSQRILINKEVNYSTGLVGEFNTRHGSSNNPMDVDKFTGDGMPNIEDSSRYTKFVFDYPIYLEGGTEYAIVVHSNSAAYKLWISDSRQTIRTGDETSENYDDDSLTTDTGTAGKNYGGSLFRSRNGKTWDSDGHSDLMFRLNICQFGTKETTNKVSPTTGTVTFGAGRNLKSDFEYDRMQLNMFTKILPSRQDTTISGSIEVENISGTKVSLTGTSGDLFNQDESPTPKDMPQRMKVQKTKSGSGESIQATFTLSTTNPDVSPQIDNRGSFVIPIKNDINAGGLRPENIKVTTRGTGYASPTIFTITGGGNQSDAIFKITADSSGSLHSNTTAITMISQADTDSSYEVAETGSGFHNSDGIVVTQHSSTSDGSGAVFEIFSEEGYSGGNSISRYQTRPITLAPGMEARGVKVFLEAVKPAGGSIHIYYKTLSEEDSEDIDRKRWKLMEQTSPNQEFFSGSGTSFNPTGQMVEYEYDSDEVTSYTTNQGETYDTFKTFAVKIVLFADDTTEPPIIKNFRAIALF